METVSAGPPPERVIIEALDGHGRVQWRERVALADGRRTFTIGRSVDADVTLDDPHAAALHASVEIMQDGRLRANDMGSLNGLIVRGKRLANACGVELTDSTLQIGRTLLRVRTGQEPLAAEKPYHSLVFSLRGPAALAGLALLVSVLQVLYTSWLGAPRDLTMSVVSSLSLAATIAAVWVAFWGLLSRIMQGEWRWLHHSAIYLGITSALVALVGVMDLAGFMLGITLSANRYVWIGAVALGLALHLHVRYASHLAAGRAALMACAIAGVLALGGHWLQVRAQERDVNYIDAYMRVYPPALRLRPPDRIEDYFAKAALLQEIASQKLADAIADDPLPDDDDN